MPACSHRRRAGGRRLRFSLFKLLGPEGVGLVIGSGDIVARVHADNYSAAARRLETGEVEGVAETRIANAQDRCLLVRFDRPIDGLSARPPGRATLPSPVTVCPHGHRGVRPYRRR